MQFPSDIQCALMFDRSGVDLGALVRTFLRIEEARSGVRYNPVEVREGSYYQLFGTNELMVTAEYIDGPANMEVFKPALSSTVTRLIFPEVAEALMRHTSHVLINVRTGAMPNLPQLSQLMADIGMPERGASLPQFRARMGVCALLSRICMEADGMSAVHWTQSDQILKPEAFEALAQLDAPGPLNIHPFLFGHEADGRQLVGIRTYGAAHFVGREVLVQPSALPWAANYDTVLAFLKLASAENGYVIPDGDTFGPEDHSLSYRVRHLDATGEDPAYYELEPLMHREFGFQAESYVPRTMTFDDRSAPSALMPREPEARGELIDEWREKRALAEGAGGRFEVRPKLPGVGGGNGGGSGGGGPPPPAPVRPVFGRKVFGRKV